MEYDPIDGHMMYLLLFFQELRTGQKISLTRQEALRKLGEIFALR